MTIVCYRAGILAADSEMSSYGLKLRGTEKLVQLDSGAAFGCAGNSCDCAAFRAWAKGGRKDQDKPKLEKNFIAIFVEPDGRAWFYEEGLFPYPTPGEFAAIGSGAEVATGAMAHGASAIKAAQIATDYAQGCGGEIHHVSCGRPRR